MMGLLHRLGGDTVAFRERRSAEGVRVGSELALSTWAPKQIDRTSKAFIQSPGRELDSGV